MGSALAAGAATYVLGVQLEAEHHARGERDDADQRDDESPH